MEGKSGATEKERRKYGGRDKGFNLRGRRIQDARNKVILGNFFLRNC